MQGISPEVLAQLVDRHFEPLMLYARQWSRTPEDVVQEAFLRLLRQAELPKNVGAWLYRVVRNEAASAARSALRRGRREARVAHRGEPWFETSTDMSLDARDVMAAVEKLPLEQREVVIARLWGGLTLEEIADLTETSTSTVHWRYQAGLAALRNRLCPRV